MTTREKLSKPSEFGSQYVFVLCLVSVGIGNIAFPPTIPIFSRYYLPICLLLVLCSFVFNARRVGSQLHYLPVVVLVFLSFLPGFLVTNLNPYGQTKLLAVVVALILVVAPSISGNISENVELALKFILLISIGTSVCLLLFGESDVAGRMTLWGLNPISTGRVAGLAVVIFFTVMVTRWQSLAPYWLGMIGIPIGVIATFQSGSRGPILAIMVSAAAILLTAGPTKTFIKRALVLSFLGFGSLLLFSSSALENTRLTTADANGRDILFGAAFDAIVASPVGIGWGNFYLELPNFSRVDAYTLYPHNIFLEIGVEGGWFALATFVVLVLLCLRNLLIAVRAGDNTATVILAILIFTLVNASLSSDFVGNRLLWLSIGLSLLPIRSKQYSNCGGQEQPCSKELSARSKNQ